MEPEDLVPVYTVSNPTEAELVRSALESVGITCQIGGEGQGGFGRRPRNRNPGSRQRQDGGAQTSAHVAA